VFSVSNNQVPFEEFHKVESQLGLRATILSCKGDSEEVLSSCREHTTDYWTIQQRGNTSIVGFISPKDAIFTKLQFDTEHTDFTFEKPVYVRPISLLLDCTPNYLNGLLAAARKNRHKIVTPRFLRFPVTYTVEDIQEAITRKETLKRERLERAAQADERLRAIPTAKLVWAYRARRLEYWSSYITIDGVSFKIGDVKAILDTREHIEKK
jgi:hypothetical protein